jgi:molybdate transport system permease protein
VTSEDWQITWFTVWASTLSLLLILPPGVALAWLLARRDWPGKSLVETLVTLPLVVPPVATGLVLLRLLGKRGLLGGWLARTFGLEIVFTWRAVVIATGVMAFPLLVRTARVAFEGVNPRLEQVARTLGAGPWRVWWTITLPLASRGLAAGAVLAFARGLGEFGATVMVAGFIPGGTVTLALSIYQEVNLGRDDRAWPLLAVSVALAFGAVWLAERLGRDSGRGGRDRPETAEPRRDP